MQGPAYIVGQVRYRKAQLSARNQMTQIESEFLEKVFLSVLDDLRHFIEFW